MHHKPKTGKAFYFCRPCGVGHLRGSLIGRLHKEYLAQGLTGKKEPVAKQEVPRDG